MLVCINNSVATKNGNNEGTTEVAHKLSPDFTAGKLALENTRRPRVKHKKIIGKKFLRNFKT